MFALTENLIEYDFSLKQYKHNNSEYELILYEKGLLSWQHIVPKYDVLSSVDLYPLCHTDPNI